MRKFSVIVLLLFYFQIIYAQKEATNWFFGDKAGLSFDSNNPSAILNSPLLGNNSVSISDNNTGELLFFSNGETVWNRELNPMPNGTNLNGLAYRNQSIIIVPESENQSRYYLFTLSKNLREDFNKGYSLYYSIIDMRLDNGKGDIVSDTKNTLLLQDSLADKITAIPHAQMDAYWLITHQLGSNRFFVHLVDGLNIEISSTQTIGTSLPFGVSSSFLNSELGLIKSSPNGKKLALAHEWTRDTTNILNLFDFDTQTGQISNYIDLSDKYVYLNGVSFSSDNSKLYLSAINLSDYVENFALIHQFDLNESNIKKSRFAFPNSDRPIEGIANDAWLPILSLASNGNIYYTRVVLSGSTQFTPQVTNFLFSINCPNEKGLAANLRFQSIEYGEDSTTPGRAPNFMQHYFQEENLLSSNEQCGTPCNFSADVVLFPNPTSDLLTITVQEGCFTGNLLEELNEINLYSVNGQLARKNIPIATTISLAGLPAGAYIVELRFSQALVRKKVIHLGNP